MTVVPPPDLAIEIDITRSSVDKLAVYAALGVAEVWLHDGEHLTIHVREPDGSGYRQVDRSAAVPELPVDGFAEFLARRRRDSDTAITRAFRRWFRDRLRSRCLLPRTVAG